MAATADELRSWAEVDALRDFMREALNELAKTRPRLFQTVDGETVDVSTNDLSGKQIFAHLGGEAVEEDAEEGVREEERLRHLLEARLAHFLLTDDGRDFLTLLLRRHLQAAELLDR